MYVLGLCGAVVSLSLQRQIVLQNIKHVSKRSVARTRNAGKHSLAITRLLPHAEHSDGVGVALSEYAPQGRDSLSLQQTMKISLFAPHQCPHRKVHFEAEHDVPAAVA